MTTVYLTRADSSPFTVPSGVSSIAVTVVGAGAGGNGGTYHDTGYGGCGGGAGSIATATIATSPGSTITFVVGAGGAKGAGVHTAHPVYGNGGGAGGQSQFGATTANGGTAVDGCIKSWPVYYYGLDGTNGPLAGGSGAAHGDGTYYGAGGTGYGAGGGGGDGQNDGAGDGYDGGLGADGIIMLVYTAAVAPVASFTHSADGTPAPLTVNFTDTSTNTPTSWNWDWDDGTAHGTTQNPSHNFTTVGTFTVTLVASNAGGSDDYSHDIVTTAAPLANFIAWERFIHNQTAFQAKVRFYDKSTFSTTKINAYQWWFGDQQTFTTNFAVSTSQLLLADADDFFSVDDRVCLTTSASDLPNGLLTTVVYWVKAVTSTYLTVSLTQGGAAVTFSDNGTGTHKVEHGSNERNPVAIYRNVASDATYTIALKVTDVAASPVTDTETKTAYIRHRTALP